MMKKMTHFLVDVGSAFVFYRQDPGIFISLKLTVINYVKICSTYFIFAATTTAATTTIQGAQRTTTSLTISSIVPVL